MARGGLCSILTRAMPVCSCSCDACCLHNVPIYNQLMCFVKFLNNRHLHTGDKSEPDYSVIIARIGIQFFVTKISLGLHCQRT